jgi:hypothetical protein
VTQVRYDVEEAGVGAGDSLADVQRSLDERIRQKSLDGYVVLPRDVIEAGRARYYARNLGDVVSIGRLERRLNRAVKEERMRRENIDPVKVQLISKDIRMTRHKPGEQKAEGVEGSFFLALAVGMFIYIAILMYGQTILSAVVEEKTTRVVEVLFSSVKPFTLIAGKLVGVSLVGLTQYVIWGRSLCRRVSLRDGRGRVLVPADLRLARRLRAALLRPRLLRLCDSLRHRRLDGDDGEGGRATRLSRHHASGDGHLHGLSRHPQPNSDFAFWVSMIPFFSPITMIGAS